MNRSFFLNRRGIKRWQRKYLSYRSILKVCMQFWKIINWLYDFFAGWYYRRQFLRQRKAAITIQKCWRSYRAKKSYLLIRRGYLRLQAMLRSRVLAHRYRHIRSVIVRFQARCRGFYVRRYLFCPVQVLTWNNMHSCTIHRCLKNISTSMAMGRHNTYKS